MPDTAKLILEDGTIFSGIHFGAEKSISGEVVFNTGMVGYYESLTDPSYRGQILVFTYPLIGNYGVPVFKTEFERNGNFESNQIQISGLIIANYSDAHNHWNSSQSLSAWMKSGRIPGLHGVDTRALTKKLRERGTMLGKLIINEDVPFYDPNADNLVNKVSIDKPVIHNENGGKTIVLIDCGVKYSIIRSLLQRELRVIQVPYDYDFFGFTFDGVVVSNGPGDPKKCPEVISSVKRCFERNIPVLGICLGNQIMALSAGADTFKLKFGHRSQNQPCLLAGTKRCYITSQNHGYAVNTDSLPPGWIPWFINANDETNEGIKHVEKPFMAVQFHPEHNPGPVDTEFIFDEFIERLKS
ncbi:MAG: glutamine-hydrolyzing carbamoyl-phosphate synthase small subunit [Candidatus Aminicenantes bacterium]|nr:glutamine-hydrolyzing carbamoyl-phosphate synthase small subunit [Candidatus Aminicenantes bacterium]